MFRVLKALCRLLDDTTWPSEDIELVSLLLTVLEHCTNSKRLRAHFVPRAQLLWRLQLQEQHHSTQQQQQGVAGQQVQQKPQVQQQAVKAAAPAPAGAPASPAAVTSITSAAVNRLVAGTNLQQQQQQGSIQSMVRPVVLQELSETTPGSAFSSPAAAAAAGPASPGQRPMGRKSADLLRRTPSGSSVSGVAFTRLAPTTSTPVSPARAAAAMQPLDAPQQHAPDAASKAHSGRDAGLGSSAAALAASSDAFSAEGCALDPAAQVVAEQPVAPVAAQSVLGSRKALKGVTAQQLLAEPVIQALLRKLE